MADSVPAGSDVSARTYRCAIQSRTGRRWLAGAVAVLAAVAAGVVAAADGATLVAKNAQRPGLRVDAAGRAEVSWTERGSRRYLLVPARGRLLPGGRAGSDVSRAVSTPSLPFLRVLRRTPDGRLWALQAWRVVPNGPVELRFSRWRGAPTEVIAAATADRLDGRVTFQGRGIHGYTPTPEGRRIRVYAYVDCFGCPAARAAWRRLIAVAPRGPDGTFTLALTPDRQGLRYRISVPGPQLGTTYAPDASTVVTRASP
jgi:hypothetical protein